MIKTPQRLPDPMIAWFEPKTGKPTTAFYQYMRELDDAMRKLITASNDYETRITDLETP
jgi:hypothetical protein